MTAICLYFKVHQPYRLKQYQSKDIEVCHCYEDAEADKTAINAIADTCYLPANTLLRSLIKKFKGEFKVSFSISGTLLELLQRYRPDVIASFKQLVKTGCVEILAETYYHSLSYLHSKKEFTRQIEKHTALVKSILNTTPTVFRNTELIHNNELARFIAQMGFKGMLCEGVNRVLQGRTSNQVYASPGNGDFGLLLRHGRLSDDIAFRFDNHQWNEFPLTAEKFAGWLHQHPEDTQVINLMLDYETLGVYKKKETGIFDFLEALPATVLSNPAFAFRKPSEVLDEHYPKDIYNVQEAISWEDKSQECCVWSENVMQNNTLKKIYSLEDIVLNSKDEELIEAWGRLQAADYIYYMADEHSRSDAGKYFNPFHTPEETHRYYINIITDLEITLIKKELSKNNRWRIPMSFLY